MITDLAGAGQQACNADVLVIGAGTAGLVMATALRRRGLDVVCIESGARHQEAETHPLNDVEQARTPYAGAAHGRFRCLGGTSTRWGGALIPFQAGDLDPEAWPLGMETLAPYVGAVESLFGLPAGPYEAPEILQAAGSHVARLAKWPPFRKRNVFNLVAEQAASAAGPRIWLNATACRFELAGDALQQVTAQAPDGSALVVRARQVVIAAGAIESTRLLLLMDRQNHGLLTRASPLLGRCFHDHLSAVIGDLHAVDRGGLNRLVGFRFGVGGTMRNLRFELTPETPLRKSVPASFAHVAFEDTGQGGFSALRDLFRLLQRGKLPGAALLLDLARAAPWLLKAVWWRLVEKRLLYPGDAGIQLHMVIDQQASQDNRITLSDERMDAYGQPLARIDWSVSDADRARMVAAADAMESTWNASQLARLARLVRRPDGAVLAQMEAGGGIYHPGGSTRMAATAAAGVVDADLRVFAVPNVRVVATSVLPTGGGANPTMTLLMLALRCVDQVAADTVTTPRA